MNLFQDQSEYSMTPATSIVHFGAGDCPVIITHLHPFQYLTNIPDRYLDEIFDVRTFRWRFSDLKVIWHISAGHQEIADMLVVNLKVGYTDRIIYVGRVIGVYPFEKVAAGARNEPRVVRSTHLRKNNLSAEHPRFS